MKTKSKGNTKMKEKFQKITNVKLPFDMRHENPGKNYGINGLGVWFILKGKKGATQFAVSFPIYLPHLYNEYNKKGMPLDDKVPRGIDVGYHSKKPQFKGHTRMDNCAVCKPCYYDGSSLRADDWAKEIFSIRGESPEKRIWEKLEQEYIERFGEELEKEKQE